MALTSQSTMPRELAHRHVYRLIHDLQAGIPGAPEELRSLVDAARRANWGEVVRAGMFGLAVASWFARDGETLQAIDALIELSSADGDDVMLALGFALRSDQGFSGGGALTAESRDADLARAVVLLEAGQGGPFERVSAHTACGVAFGNRWLFELANDQYAAALAVGDANPEAGLDYLLAAIMFNLAEAEVSWASMLRQLGDLAGVEQRWRSWRATSEAVETYAIAQSWAGELEALGLLLGAIAGEDASFEAERRTAALASGPGEARTAGLLRLAIALSDATAHRPSAAEHAEAAIAALDADLYPHVYDLALHLAAEIESGERLTAGLRHAKRQLEEQRTNRLATLGAMRSRIQAERLSTERDLLTRHAHLDDLTGIGNRRALDRFLADLEHHGVAGIAMILVDVNAFKAVNDRFGHPVGDRVLMRIASVLDMSIRPSDLAVRLGGDEFVVLLADADLEIAYSRAVEILTRFERQSFEEVHPALTVTLSAGVASGSPAAAERIFADADQALYQAKAGTGEAVGRSRLARGAG